MLTRDERRFKSADRDGDGIATREEFTAFLHPEEFDYMKDVVVQVETIIHHPFASDVALGNPFVPRQTYCMVRVAILVL